MGPGPGPMLMCTTFSSCFSQFLTHQNLLVEFLLAWILSLVFKNGHEKCWAVLLIL